MKWLNRDYLVDGVETLKQRHTSHKEHRTWDTCPDMHSHLYTCHGIPQSVPTTGSATDQPPHSFSISITMHASVDIGTIA